MKLTSSKLPVVTPNIRQRIQQRYENELMLNNDEYIRGIVKFLKAEDEILYQQLNIRINSTTADEISATLSWAAASGVYFMLTEQRIKSKTPDLPKMTREFMDRYLQEIGDMSQKSGEERYGLLMGVMRNENNEVLEFIFDIGRKAQGDVPTASVGLTGLCTYELLHKKGLQDIIEEDIKKF